MTTSKDEWIRVRSESELRAGMCVELRPCHWCGRRERLFLGGSVAAAPRTLLPSGKIVPTTCLRAWIMVGRCRDDRTKVDMIRAIDAGELFRLADSQLTEDETTRELERVR